LLPILDEHSFSPHSVGQSTFVASLHRQHNRTDKYFRPNSTSTFGSMSHASTSANLFGVRHFAGPVVYDAAEFTGSNADRIAGDVIAAFDRRLCAFGFVSHLFANELTALNTASDFDLAKCMQFRASVIYAGSPPTLTPSCTSPQVKCTSGSMSAETSLNSVQRLHSQTHSQVSLTTDFHNRLDGLLRKLVHARPHFVICIRSGSSALFTAGSSDVSAASMSNRCDSSGLLRQLRALQLLPLAQLMQTSLPHRMRYVSFHHRFRCVLFEPTVCARTALLANHRCSSTNRFSSSMLVSQSANRSNRSRSPEYTNYSAGSLSMSSINRGSSTDQERHQTHDALHKCRSILLCLAEKGGLCTFQIDSPINRSSSIAKSQSMSSGACSEKVTQSNWAFGRGHLFFSERVRQELESLRTEKRCLAATLIQCRWKAYLVRRRMRQQKQQIGQCKSQSLPVKQRNQIAVIRPLNTSIASNMATANQSINCDEQLIEKTCAAFGLDYVSLGSIGFFDLCIHIDFVCSTENSAAVATESRLYSGWQC
jgi:myosin heavy subunit